jgi:hypothetical protein
MRSATVPSEVLDRSKCTKLGSIWAIGQGLFAAVAPRQAVGLGKKMLKHDFENVDELEPRPAYLRQVRALGIGLAAAGIAGYAMERVATDERGETVAADETDADAE